MSVLRYGHRPGTPPVARKHYVTMSSPDDCAPHGDHNQGVDPLDQPANAADDQPTAADQPITGVNDNLGPSAGTDNPTISTDNQRTAAIDSRLGVPTPPGTVECSGS